MGFPMQLHGRRHYDLEAQFFVKPFCVLLLALLEAGDGFGPIRPIDLAAAVFPMIQEGHFQRRSRTRKRVENQISGSGKRQNQVLRHPFRHHGGVRELVPGSRAAHVVPNITAVAELGDRLTVLARSRRSVFLSGVRHWYCHACRFVSLVPQKSHRARPSLAQNESGVRIGNVPDLVGQMGVFNLQREVVVEAKPKPHEIEKLPVLRSRERPVLDLILDDPHNHAAHSSNPPQFLGNGLKVKSMTAVNPHLVVGRRSDRKKDGGIRQLPHNLNAVPVENLIDELRMEVVTHGPPPFRFGRQAPQSH